MADFPWWESCVGIAVGGGETVMSDKHGVAGLAMAGLALNDYDNPNKISMASSPGDWVKCGTEYMWVNDLLHDNNRSLASWAFEESTGKDYVGYNAYVDESLLLFAQAYSHFYDRNYFEDYPLAKKHFLVETWSALPNDRRNFHGGIGTARVRDATGHLALVHRVLRQFR